MLKEFFLYKGSFDLRNIYVKEKIILYGNKNDYFFLKV